MQANIVKSIQSDIEELAVKNNNYLTTYRAIAEYVYGKLEINIKYHKDKHNKSGERMRKDWCLCVNVSHKKEKCNHCKMLDKEKW